jgi:hypothetical protein
MTPQPMIPIPIFLIDDLTPARKKAWHSHPPGRQART